MTVLIVTFSQDNESVSLVTQAIEAQGGTAFRFDTDRFPTEVQLEIGRGKPQRGLIMDGDRQLDLREVSSVWYRRARYGQQLPDTMDPQYRDAAIKESRTTIRGVLASIQGFHFDKLSDVDLAKNKQLQLQVAQDVGLTIPRTLITNNPEAVKRFAADCKEQGIVTKMLTSFAIFGERGEEQVVFTNPVTDRDLENLEGLRLCPMTFQEKVPKALELRITIVGHQVFTAAVDSQRLDGAAYDWRKEGRALVKVWKPYDLPETVEKKLLKLMAYFDLNYGAIDIIVTPDDRYVFLEVNPVGEFFWMELFPPNFPISQAVAKILLSSQP